MKRKTSITLSEDTLRDLDAATGKGESRSEVIDRLLREAFALKARQDRDARDLEIINAYADELNAEGEEVLRFQVDL